MTEHKMTVHASAGVSKIDALYKLLSVKFKLRIESRIGAHC
jgi:hypothetical protein